MLDTTPPPFGDITRRWTHLDESERTLHIARLVGAVCPGDPVHVDRPSTDGGLCYQQLAHAALAGDEIAIGWLATSHRPLLITRGRRLLEDDPSEWGGLCLWLLHSVLERADTSDARWLRRCVAGRLTSRLSAAMALYVRRRQKERVAVPTSVFASRAFDPVEVWDPHPELSLDLDRLLGELDEPSRDALWALAYHEPLAEVADRHGLTHTALRQRVTRARKGMQTELAHYRRRAA
jgi:DNA-directed RNA polymerase specialized sigma24 family protein